MQVSRNTLYAALFTYFSSVTGFASGWRRILDADALSSAVKPALMMQQVSENLISEGRGLPPKYEINVELYIICDTQTTTIDAIPSTTVNTLVDAVEAAITVALSQVDNVNNLAVVGVSRVYVNGMIKYKEAVAPDEHTWAMVPITIITS